MKFVKSCGENQIYAVVFVVGYRYNHRVVRSSSRTDFYRDHHNKTLQKHKTTVFMLNIPPEHKIRVYFFDFSKFAVIFRAERAERAGEIGVSARPGPPGPALHKYAKNHQKICQTESVFRA